MLLVTLTLTVSLPRAHAAESVVEVIATSRAADLVPVLAPLVGDGGSIGAYQDQLVIRSTPEKLAEIRALLKTLDRPLRNLLVEVRRSGRERSEQHAAGSTGQVLISNGGLRLRGEVQLQHDTDTRAQNDRYQIRAVEGSTVFLASGQDVPVLSVLPATRPVPGAVASQAWLPAPSGVQVTPRLLADGQVLLDVEFVESRVDEGGIARVGGRTQLTIPPGQWAPFARIEQRQQASRQGVTGRDASTQDSATPLEIRVQILP